jgi:predicted nucleic acid-binding Zn ribbon protein
MASHPEALRFFEHIVGVFSGAKRKRKARELDLDQSLPFEPGRDPRSIAAIVGASIEDRGWTPFLARASVLAQWEDIVGADVAGHTNAELVDDTLVVSCDSSAWATQLRMLRHDILREIEARFPDNGIDRVEVLGPGVPPQIRGPRSVKWRGPRDTYG